MGVVAVGQASMVTTASAEDVLAFIMDVEAYQAVDPRLKTITWVRRSPGETVFRFRPRLMGMPGPRTTQRVVLTAGRRVDIIPVPSPMDRIVLFAGLLECVEEDGLVRVHRRLEFRFARPLSWLLDPLMRRWLAKDVPAELARLKAHLEATT
ncbi:Polyketide cyclase / dehydrase and lipid transport [Geodermatophilus sp. DSM 45219]|nr:Polyketide cyclase / dehydrase and lipid transport [Geodermatophilus sp. DSM 45219]